MLSEALIVVEAARDLRIVRRGQRVATEHDAAGLARAMAALLEALERFDRETAETVEAGMRPNWAVPPQIADGPPAPLPVPTLAPGGPRGAVPEDAEDPEVEPEPGAAPRRDPRPVPPPAMAATLVPAAHGLSADLGDDGAFYDGDESVGDFLMALDAIDDKLRYAVGKVGWSPRLRALAEAGRIARQNMFVETFDTNGAWVRLPASTWSTLTVAMAEAALDQDFPQPAPPAPGPARDARRRALEERLDHAPPAPRPAMP